VTKYLKEVNLKEERFNLAYGFSPWLLGPVAFRHVACNISWQKCLAEESCSLNGGQEVRKEEEEGPGF
jgi:hypothetical protein